jgi:hypothetical protein
MGEVMNRPRGEQLRESDVAESGVISMKLKVLPAQIQRA